MLFNNEKGQTSLFLLVIFVPVVIVSIILIDVTRMHAAEKQAEDAIRSAAKSVLARYSSKLKEDYGLFALSTGDNDSIETEIMEYIESNLGIKDGPGRGNGIKLYDFKIESLEVSPVFNLTENTVTRAGILEYMKYRAPKALIEGILDKLKLFGNSSGMAGAYRRKTAIDKALADTDSAIRELKRYTEGWAGGFETPVNSFNENGSREQTIRSIADDIVERRALTEELAKAEQYESYVARLVREQEEYLEKIHSEIRRLREQVERQEEEQEKQQQEEQQQEEQQHEKQQEEQQGPDGEPESEPASELDVLIRLAEEQEKKLEQLINELDEAIDNAGSVRARISGIETSIVEEWTRLEETETLPFIAANRKAVEAVNKVEKNGGIVKSAVEELKQYLRTAGTGDSMIGILLSELENELLDGLACLLQEETVGRIRESLQANIKILDELKETLEQYDEIVKKHYDLPGDRDSIIRLLTGRQDEYLRSITIEYERVGQGRKDDDPREGILQKAGEFFKQAVLQYGDIAKSGFDINELPSVKKAKGGYPDSSSVYEGDSTRLEDEVDFDEKDCGFVSNAFGFMETTGGGIGDELTGLRDELYINEYILETFYSAADKGGRRRNSLFDGEVEYIIHGMASGKLNRLAVRGEITLLRFAMNTLHVYTDARKKALAASLATAIAGWWTGGAGIPVISNMIMCSWGLGESLLDTASLLKGEEVPFYKTQSEWKLDIGLPAGEEGIGGTGAGIKFGYEDYLRLFLLFVDPDTKIDRVQDLICLNLYEEGREWRLDEYNTCIRVEAAISVNYLFIPRLDIAGVNAGTGNRKEFSFTVYESY